jgi:hypothetical protein
MTANWFLRAAMAFGLVGMGLGIFMAAASDHVLAPTHAHVNLIGWVGMFLAGLFYRTHPDCEGRLARVQLGLAIVGLTIMAPGIAGVNLAQSWGPPLAAIGSIVTFAATLIFAFQVVRGTSREIAADRPLTEARATAGG